MGSESELVAIDHITITVQDMAAVKDFYERVIGLPVETDVVVEGEDTAGGFALQGDDMVELNTDTGAPIFDQAHGVRHMVIFERVGGTGTRLTLITHPGDTLGGAPTDKLDRLGYTHLALDVRDLEAFTERVRMLGVEPAAPGFYRDPEGNIVQVQQVGHADRIHDLYRERYVGKS